MTLQIYYWPVPLRGNFIKLLLEDANVPYRVAPPEDVAALKNLDLDEQKLAGMAPPYLYDDKRNVFLNQTPVILEYLAITYGYATDDLYKSLVASKVAHDCMDVIVDLTNSNGIKMWNREDWFQFKTERFPRWLQIFEAVGKKFGLTEKEGYLLGTKEPTYADTTVLALLATMRQCLPELAELVQPNAPLVDALCDRMGRRARIRVFLDRQKQALGDLYCGGDIERSIRDMIRQDREENKDSA